MYEWFKANKLSLNEKKTKFTLFHKASQKDNLPLRLPKLFINDKQIERAHSIKFLGVVFDEHLSWNENIRVIENKVSKNLGVLYKSKHILDKFGLKSLFFSFIHTSYLNYGNIAWGSTVKTKLKTLASKQKQAVRTIANKNECNIR